MRGNGAGLADASAMFLVVLRSVSCSWLSVRVAVALNQGCWLPRRSTVTNTIFLLAGLDAHRVRYGCPPEVSCLELRCAN